jgi:hypothetical protein
MVYRTYGRIAYMLEHADDETKQDWAAGRIENITDRDVIALDLAGWKIVPKEAERHDGGMRPRWPFDSSRTGPCPDWCEDISKLTDD